MGGHGPMTSEIVLDEKLIKKNKIPVLVLDKDWKSLFEKNMTRPMKKAAKNLETMVAEEKQAIRQMTIYKKQKKALMKKILQFSDEVNHNQKEEALGKLEQAKNQILEINDQIDELQYKLETLPKEIEKLNLMLLKDTIVLAYKGIEEDSTKIDVLTEEIGKLRQQLAERWDEKITLEEGVQRMYSYLHNTLGHEETNKLDKKFFG